MEEKTKMISNSSGSNNNSNNNNKLWKIAFIRFTAQEYIWLQYVRHCDCVKMNNVFNLIHNEHACAVEMFNF